MTVIFDTGSNVLWVPSSDCPTCRKNVNKYNSKISQTSQELNSTKSISYAIGYVQGNFCYDTVSLNSKGNFKAKELLFLNVKEESNLTGTVSDGVFGLGIFNEDDPQISLIETLYNQKQINEPAFSFYLLGINNISRLFIGDILKNGKQTLIIQNVNDYREPSAKYAVDIFDVAFLVGAAAVNTPPHLHPLEAVGPAL